MKDRIVESFFSKTGELFREPFECLVVKRNRAGSGEEVEAVTDNADTDDDSDGRRRSSLTFALEQKIAEATDLLDAVTSVCSAQVKYMADIDAISRVIVHNLLRFLPCKMVFIGQIASGLDGALSVIRVNHIYREDGGEMSQSLRLHEEVPIYPTQENIHGYAINENTIVISDCLAKDPRRKDPCSICVDEYENMCGIPMTRNAKTHGYLCFAGFDQSSIKEQIYALSEFWTCVINVYWMFVTREESIRLQKTLDLARERQIAQLSEESKAKEAFLAMMSHELRTPLNGVIAMTGLLAETDLHGRQQHYLSLLTKCGLQLLEQVNDILDLSSLRSGKLVLNEVEFNIHDLVEDAVAVAKSQIEMKGIDLSVSIAEYVPKRFIGDSQRLRQILVNLLGNANKFTEKGFIRVSVDAELCGDDNSTNSKWEITIEVQDSGCGILEKDFVAIFEHFSRVDASSQRKAGGAGLGLAISRELINLMGGRIAVRSDGKTGSTFTVTVKLPDCIDTNALLNNINDVVDGKRLLIVDDKLENRIYLTDIAMKWKMQPQTCSTAREAIAYLEKSPENYYSMAWIDVHMTPVSGVQLAQTIRTMPRYMGLPLFSFSSIGPHFSGRDIFDRCYQKPVSESQLLRGVADTLSRNQSSSSTGSGERRRSSAIDQNELPNSGVRGRRRKLRILVAEDDDSNQIVISEILSSLNEDNYTIVANGKQVLDELEKSDITFDVVFLDVFMPEMNGVECAKRIVEQYRYPERPILVAVTASVLDSTKMECLQSGMEFFISKPIIRSSMASVLKVIRKRRNLVDSGGALKSAQPTEPGALVGS